MKVKGKVGSESQRCSEKLCSIWGQGGAQQVYRYNEQGIREGSIRDESDS